jgi:DNA replication and repair protein RecF
VTASPAIRELVLAQFRSHPQTRLALDGRPVVLHGPNGAGKTNVLEAVSLLSPGRGLRRAKTEELARAPGALGWRVRAEIDAAGGRRAVTLGVAEDGRKTLEIEGKAETQTALGRIAPMLWLTPPMDRLWIEGAEGRRRFLDRAALSFFPAHAEAALIYEKAMRERNRLLREDARDPTWLDALEARMADSGAALARARIDSARRLLAAQKSAKTLFPNAQIAIIGDMETRIAEAATLAPDAAAARAAAWLREALARGRDRDAAAGRTLVGPHRTDMSATYAEKGMEARHCSTGEQKALLISLVLANARALAQEAGGAPILLLDEVAAHLDAERRAALFDEICGLGAQAWMTGVGPELFEALGPRAQSFALSERDGASQVSETRAA